MQAEVLNAGILSMQVCVPIGWTDCQVLIFANCANECGTENGWCIRKEGDRYLKGDPERNPCQERQGFVHVMLDA